MRTKILLLGVAGFLLTACNPGVDILSMSIKKTNETLPPQYQMESTAIITPDYNMKTLDVSYSSKFTNDETKDKLKKRLVIEDEELFGKFIETVRVVDNYVKDEGDGCTGGDTYDVEIEDASREFTDKSIYVCGGDSPFTPLGDFYDLIQAKMK